MLSDAMSPGAREITLQAFQMHLSVNRWTQRQLAWDMYLTAYRYETLATRQIIGRVNKMLVGFAWIGTLQ